MAPSGLSYLSPQTYTVEQAITPLSPSVTGTVTAYSVSPALPAGLSLNAGTGQISGTPTAATAQATYTITATNAGGSATFGLVITVRVAAPSGLSYPSPQTYTVGQAILPLNPTVTGTVTSYSVSPALPAGLSLNATSGQVTGTPTAATAQSTYVVTASNASGSTSAGLVITIQAAVAIDFRLHPNNRIGRLITPLATIWGTNNIGDNARTIANQLYTLFFDNFDFIILIGVGDSSTVLTGSQYYGINVTARNDVQGIGLSTFNNTAAYGSAGRLRAIAHLNMRNGLRNGPSLHELLHTWANFVVDTGLSAHWNFSSSGGGQLGGFDGLTLKDLGGGKYQATNGSPGSTSFGTIANGGNSVPYSDIELYLMGMRAAAGTPDVNVALNPVMVDGANGIFTASGFTNNTIGSIVTRLGPRAPDASTSPKTFHVLIVVLTTAELSAAEFDSLDNDARLFGLPGDDGRPGEYNFWEATRGVGTLTVEGLNADRR